VIREKEPGNLEAPFEALDVAITPNDRSYVRNHFKVPEVDAKAYRLKVEGAVNQSLALSLDELRGMKAASRQVTLECAGNGRVSRAEGGRRAVATRGREQRRLDGGAARGGARTRA
jgi:DMSO/TMAO reductase YedYZ molybdopterin-dependent catalytic subunit